MERTYTVDELFSAIRRRWKMMAIVAGAVLALSAVVIARIPDEYRARAVVMVEPFTPHPDLVVPVMGATSLEEKVKSVRAQVYARSLMATTIEELKLYPKEREKHGMDSAVESLRLDTEVHPEGDNAFAITVRGQDPQVAAKVANRLAELDIEGNLQVRSGQVSRTRDIITSKLAEMRGELNKAEAKVTAYKQAHQDSLPEMLESRLHERDALAKQIEGETNFSNEALHRIDLLGTQPSGKDTEVGRLEEQYDEMRVKLGAASAQLTPDHPDVVALKRETEATFGRLENARARSAQNDLELRRMNEAVGRGKRRVTDLESRVDKLDKLIASTPMTQSGLNELARDADMLKVKVTQLISKKTEAEITAELEQKSGPSEFRILESAQPPTVAASPNRGQALLLALIASIALGCAVALAQELSDRSLRSEGEMADTISLPVLACIPALSFSGGSPRMLAAHSEAEA